MSEKQKSDKPSENKNLSLDAHLFICTNIKKSGECCGAKGSAELRDALKALSKDPQRNWRGRLRVNNSGCLGHCEKGIVAVLYPQGQWFTELKKDDVAILEQALAKVLDAP